MQKCGPLGCPPTQKTSHAQGITGARHPPLRKKGTDLRAALPRQAEVVPTGRRASPRGRGGTRRLSAERDGGRRQRVEEGKANDGGQVEAKDRGDDACRWKGGGKERGRDG